MQPSDANVGNSFDPITHDFGGDGCFFGHREIAGSSANDRDGSRTLRRRLFVYGDTARRFVVNCVPKFLTQGASMLSRDSGYQNACFTLEKPSGNLDNLRGSFSRAENHFGKAFPQGTMCIYLGEAKVHGRSGLESVQDFFAAEIAHAKFFQQFDGFRRGHAIRVP
jgi:hypothetical protein